MHVLPGRTTNSSIFHVGDGFLYHVREVRPRRIRLKCRYIKKGCRGTASMYVQDGRLILQHLQPHSCPRDLQAPADILARVALVDKAKTSTSGESVRKILRDFKLRYDGNLSQRNQ